jgi:hypothetical protein
VPTYKPHRFYFDLNRLQYDRYLFIRQKLTGNNLYGTLSCDHAIYWTFGERVERSVMSPHEIRFQQVTTVAVVFKFTLVQLHGQVGRLKIERHHLTAGIPEDLRHVIRRVGSGTARIDARHLAFVVIDEFDRLALQIVQTRRFGKARHVVMNVPFLGVVKTLEFDRLGVVHHGTKPRMHVGRRSCILDHRSDNIFTGRISSWCLKPNTTVAALFLLFHTYFNSNIS